MHPAVAAFAVWPTTAFDGAGIYRTSSQTAWTASTRITVLAPTPVVELAVSPGYGRVFATIDRASLMHRPSASGWATGKRITMRIPPLVVSTTPTALLDDDRLLAALDGADALSLHCDLPLGSSRDRGA